MSRPEIQAERTAYPQLPRFTYEAGTALTVLALLGYHPDVARLVIWQAQTGGYAALPEHGVSWDEDGFFIDVHETPGALDVVLAVTRETLTEWAEILDDEQLARLRAAIPWSSVPEALSTIAATITDSGDSA
jgi:hypothetical protein